MTERDLAWLILAFCVVVLVAGAFLAAHMERVAALLGVACEWLLDWWATLFGGLIGWLLRCFDSKGDE